MGVLRSAGIFALVIAVLSGCVSFPGRVGSTVEHARLRDHVSYLAQPALKGRKPLSRGSRLAREYIRARFEAAGLHPWGKTEGFEQSIHIGTNVIGVLPGADPAVANDIVLVSAHYDHIGRGRLGASDNASGVAALLELVERFSANPPRRSICFAAFDCEEWGLFGAFAFTMRDDFDPSSLVAVVNMDMLGRDFLEVVDRSLIVSGTEGYEATRRVVAEACAAQEMQFMPLSPDLVGPRSDHVAFRPLDVPCIFFTCGVFDGYHTAKDTAAFLDYDALMDSMQVVFDVVEALATQETIERYVRPDEPDREELSALATTLAALNENACALELSPETQGQLQAFLDETVAPHVDGAADQSYTFEARDHMAESVIGALGAEIGHLVLGASDEKAPDSVWLRAQWSLSRLFSRRPNLISHAYGGFVAHVLEHRPIPVLKPLPPYAFEETVDEAVMMHHADGLWELVHIPLTVTVNTRMKRYNLTPHGRVEFSLVPRYFAGSREELVDYLFLEWFVADEDARDIWQTALERTGAIEDGADVEAARLAWLRDLGCDTTEAWSLRMLSSGNPWLVHTGMALLRARPEQRTPTALAVLQTVAEDTEAPAWLREVAIGWFSTMDDEKVAVALGALTADTIAIEPIFKTLAFDTSRAFYHHESSAFVRAAYAEAPEEPTETVGEHALNILKEVQKRRAPAR